jgi:hypothetical protein
MNPSSDITVTLPGKLTAEDLAQCLAVIKEGDAVNIESATEELPLAKFVAVHRVDGKIVAVGAIKRQRGWYAEDVGKKSGVEVATDMHELGYVSVTENQKGKSSPNGSRPRVGGVSGPATFRNHVERTDEIRVGGCEVRAARRALAGPEGRAFALAA